MAPAMGPARLSSCPISRNALPHRLPDVSLQPFDRIVEQHGATVLRVCRAVVGPVDAEDAWSETFLDDGTRGRFHNAAEFAVLYPGAPAPGGFVAPRVEAGFALQAIRDRLARIAAQDPAVASRAA